MRHSLWLSRFIISNMADTNLEPDKPLRLYFKSYLQLIHNSIGSNMFRSMLKHLLRESSTPWMMAIIPVLFTSVQF